MKCSTGLSECGHLTGKPLAGSSLQVNNPATSPSPFPIHCDLPTEENKYSRSERSGFAEPAHIAAETLLATHRRTRCALKRLADRSQPTLLGMLSQRVGSAYLAYAVGLQAPFIQQLLGLKSVDTAYKH